MHVLQYIFGILCFVFFLTVSPHNVLAQNQSAAAPQTTYYKAEVIEILEEGEKVQNQFTSFFQLLKVQIQNGNEKGKQVEIEQGGLTGNTPQQLLQVKDTIIISKTELPSGETMYSLLDRYRLDSILYILIGFFALVIFFAGKRGVGAIIGLVVSIFVILQFIVPQVLAGKDPVLISILGSLVIIFVTMYLAHGFSKKISVAVVATLLSLTLTGIFAVTFVSIAKLSGFGSEEASFLLRFQGEEINMQGLLLAGIIIGALGVLDDITTAQSAAIFELHKTDKTLSFVKLVKSGYAVGREHITSLVNTLVLAYAGSSLSLFILFVLNPANQPYWVILNSEIIIEEVIRTLAGSIGLILAVPITTLLAAWVCTSKRFQKIKLEFKLKNK